MNAPKLSRVVVGFLILSVIAGPTFAQNAPLQLPQGSPAAKAIGAAAPAARPASADNAANIQRANAWFNSNATMIGDFTQTGADGKIATGKLYVQKPGKLRFIYDRPATIDITADGTSVAIRDRKTATQELAYIWQTPLKFLLQEKIDLAKDTRVLDVASSANAVSILIEDKATLGGTSRIKLVFDSKSFALTQWQVTDPQGYLTSVSLANLDFKTRPEPELFKINMEKFN